MTHVVKTTVEIDGPVRIARVPSLSRPGEKHKVVVSCDCKGFRYGGYCRHVALASSDLRATAKLVRSYHEAL